MIIPEKTQAALDYAESAQQEVLDRLFGLLRFPTVSAEYALRREEFESCAAWLAAQLKEMGFTAADALPTGGAPVVYGEWSGAGKLAPTILIYGHYDVMPAGAVEEWSQPPFDPILKNNRIWARGASDDKGQFFAVLCAAEAWIKGAGGAPVNLKVLLEGEEEDLSRHLPQFLQEKADLFRCDGIVVADMGGLDPRVPLVMYGTRGNLSMEVKVSGPSRDLHSGTYGGGVDNPLNVLVRMLAAMQDGETRRVQVPGFYDRVKELSGREQALLEAVPITDEAGQFLTGVPALGGEPMYPLKMRVSSRPTFEVLGIVGGYTGPGVKTIIPSSVTAKLSFRLVPDQDPLEINQQVQEFLSSIAPPTVNLEFNLLGRAAPATVNLDAPVVAAADEAFLRSFGVKPKYVRGGGSLPILTVMQTHLHRDALLTGFGLPEDCEHSPNESFSLEQFRRGMQMMIHYFEIVRLKYN